MKNFWSDLRWSSRVARRYPKLTLIIVLSLGLAMGVNTAVFSVVNAFLLRPLAIEDIDRVVRVRESYVETGEEADLRSPVAVTFLQWKEHQTVFEDMAGGVNIDLALTGVETPEYVAAAAVTGNFFSVLGIEPHLGRDFLPEEDRPGSNQVVLLGYGVWQRLFAGDDDVLGRSLMLNGEPHTVVGVMPRGLRHPYEAEMWVPIALQNDPSDQHNLYIPARLREGISLERAEATLSDLVGRLHSSSALEHPPLSANLRPLRDELVEDLDEMLLVLFVAAGLVLLIAVANVSNLILAQSFRQTRNMAIRVAVGASRGRLVRQYLTYGVLLSLVGGALGVLLTFWSIRPLVALSPVYGLGQFDIEPRMDLTTLGFTFGVALAVGVVFGLVSGLRMARSDLQTPLKEGGPQQSGSLGSHRLVQGLVVFEVALALVLLTGALLMTRSLYLAQTEDRGFDMENVLTAEVNFPELRYPGPEERARFIDRALERLRSLPGVRTVGATTTHPFFTGTMAAAFNVEGQPPTGPPGYLLTHHRTITPGYMRAMGIPLIEGRLFDERDADSEEPMVVVSESLAERYWPGESAVGQRLKRGLYDSDYPWLRIIGVVGTLKENKDELIDIDDAWYLNYRQPAIPEQQAIIFALETEVPPRTLVPSIRAAIQEVDEDLPVYDVATLQERLSEETGPTRLKAILYGILSLLGLLLAGIGIFGVISFSVSQRIQEIGVRSALGASPRDIRRWVFRKALVLGGTGLVLGILFTQGLIQLFSSQVYGVNPRDPVIFGVAVLTAAAIVWASSYLPARRAARIDPVSALRYE